jgi:hypothetical protein
MHLLLFSNVSQINITNLLSYKIKSRMHFYTKENLVILVHNEHINYRRKSTFLNICEKGHIKRDG